MLRQLNVLYEIIAQFKRIQNYKKIQLVQPNLSVNAKLMQHISTEEHECIPARSNPAIGTVQTAYRSVSVVILQIFVSQFLALGFFLVPNRILKIILIHKIIITSKH